MLAINDNARNGQRRNGPGPHYGPESAQGARDCPLVIGQAPSALAARYSAVVNYTASAGHVSTRPGRRAAGDRESSLVTAAVQSPERIARRRFGEAAPGVLGALRRPWLRWPTAIRPCRPVLRPCRPARAVCPHAAQMPRPHRTNRPAAPRPVRLPACPVRGTACWLARRAEDGYQPRSQQDEDNRGHDEHRRRRHGRTRVRQVIPFLRRQAAGAARVPRPGTGSRRRR